MRPRSPRGSGLVGRSCRMGLILAVCALGLAACATVSPSRPGFVTAEQGPDLSVSVPRAGGLRGTDKPYQIDGRWYYPHAQPDYDEVGFASWYGQQFHNHHTADGEIFDQFALSAAHKTLPLPCIVEVTNLDNGRRLKLRVNDRGPFVGDRLLDVSRAAAETLGFQGRGLAHVRVRYVGPAPPLAPYVYARAEPQRRLDYAQAASAAPATSTGSDQEPGAQALAQPSQPVVAVASSPEPDVAAADTESASPSRTFSPGDRNEDGASVAAAGSSPAPIIASPVLTAAPPLAIPAAAFSVQAGAFASRDNAQRVAERLARAGDARISITTNSQGVTLYRVILAGYRDVRSAQAARDLVVAAGFGDARIIGSF